MIGPPKFKMSHVTLTTPLSEMVCHCRLGLAMLNLRTNFEVSFSMLTKIGKAMQNVEIGVVWGT